MKILIVSQYYNPEQFQINEIAPELVRRGHQVTVLTGLPNYPQGDIYPGYEGNEHRDEVIDGVRIVRVKAHPRKHGAIHRIRNYFSYAVQAARKAKRLDKDYDLVFSYQLSPVMSIYPAVVYARKNKVPHLTYCLDIWPESAKAHLSYPGLYAVIGRISRKLYRACDHITVTSRPFIDYLADVNGCDRSRMSYIPQHADDSMLRVDLTAEDNGIADFMYAGNMGKGQTLDVIIRAAALLKDRKDFMVHMVGDGSERQELENLARELGISDRVIFYGNQPRQDMPSFYKKADALLITLRGNNAVGNTMPGKLQMYMTTGKLILGAINGAAGEVIHDAGCGQCVAAGDAEGLARIMTAYIDHPEQYTGCGDNAKRYFKEHFTFTQCMDRLEAELKNSLPS